MTCLHDTPGLTLLSILHHYLTKCIKYCTLGQIFFMFFHHHIYCCPVLCWLSSDLISQQCISWVWWWTPVLDALSSWWVDSCFSAVHMCLFHVLLWVYERILSSVVTVSLWRWLKVLCTKAASGNFWKLSALIPSYQKNVQHRCRAQVPSLLARSTVIPVKTWRAVMCHHPSVAGC